MKQLKELLEFLNRKMSMTDIYQPVIILHLLEQGGNATRKELARILSAYDQDIQDEYDAILMRWPKITLTKHDVVIYDQKNKSFQLNFDLNDTLDLESAKEICVQKIREWIQKRIGKGISKLGASVRYRILKAARGKCELCGISSKVAQIDVDHIIPRNKADSKGYVIKDGITMHLDDERNLQALCYKCNRAKRDQDTTDFRITSKLVRDKIPEIITNSGRIPIVQQITGEKLLDQLYEKLVEEHAELLESKKTEEIADMIEVLLSIAKVQGYSEESILKQVYEKRIEKGSFDRGYFLLNVAG